MAEEASSGEIQAAGAVLWRARAGGIEIALVHRPRYDDWSFPKGKSLPGEHVLLTAVREVQEETGVRPALGRRLNWLNYFVDGLPKRVDYWAGRPVSAPPFTPNSEVDALAWLPVAAARERLSYPRDVTVLDTFETGPADTAPLILLRHAVAVPKKEWRKAGHTDDLSRPLSDRGRAQAAILAELLCCFAPARVICSAAERCQATATPYAERAGVAVTVEPAFTADSTARTRGEADWTETPAARQLITDAATAARPVIICAHRQNLPWLLAQACAAIRAPVPEGPPLQRGAFWVLQVGGRRLASAEQHQAQASPAGVVPPGLALRAAAKPTH
jgi:8-oxo-(d)GTP phosphatase